MKKKLTKKQANKIFTKLGWEILEHKFRYYCGSEYGLTPIPDDKYDIIETNYKKLAKLLKIKPTACSYVGFPSDRPCGRLVASKLAKRKKGLTSTITSL